ncbi:MAG TPA: YdcF family protein [Candidatus Acidoferrum sp.]|nr:YdcF family protein [Candidatus Acidoferrum sp.]
MPVENESGAAPPKRRRTRRIVLVLLGMVLLSALLFFLRVGRWLVVEDPLEKAQAIVVLSGRMPMRAMEAAKLYRERYAPEVWLTHSAEPGATLGAMGISYAGEDSYNTQVLMHEGVPERSIRLLQPAIINTADEIAAVSATLEEEKGKSVIIVTTKAHTRRVRILWQRLAAGRGRAVIRAASDDPFEPRRWWRTTGDALDVVREFLGILNAWAGMPLRPAN